MSILSAHVTEALFTSDFFTLAISRTSHNIHITLQLLTPIINTRDLPFTRSLLKRNLPSILHSECFNDDNYSFSKEVRSTEIGHLFEHILLEYLCMGKLKEGSDFATYSGLTSWNWKKEPRGMFHITINIGLTETIVLTQALAQTVMLLNTILQTKTEPAPLFPHSRDISSLSTASL